MPAAACRTPPTGESARLVRMVKMAIKWEPAHLSGGFSSDEKSPCKWAALAELDEHRGFGAAVTVGDLDRSD